MESGKDVEAREEDFLLNARENAFQLFLLLMRRCLWTLWNGFFVRAALLLLFPYWNGFYSRNVFVFARIHGIFTKCTYDVDWRKSKRDMFGASKWLKVKHFSILPLYLPSRRYLAGFPGNSPGKEVFLRAFKAVRESWQVRYWRKTMKASWSLLAYLIHFLRSSTFEHSICWNWNLGQGLALPTA